MAHRLARIAALPGALGRVRMLVHLSEQIRLPNG
jgi:hypothetical protein